MKSILKLIEEREKKNRQYKEEEDKKKQQINQNKEKNRKIMLEKEKEKKLKQEQLDKEKKLEKERLEKEEEIRKQKEKEDKLKKLDLDTKRREEFLLNFRKQNNIQTDNFKDNIQKRIGYWNDLSLKEKDALKRRNILKKMVLKNQYDSRNKASSISQKDVTKVEEIKKQITTIEDMCILGDILKKEIIEEKKENPEKFIPIEEALKIENKEDPNYILGLLAKRLENIGITTLIEKDKIEEEKEIEESTTSLQFLINGLATKKKYNLHFDISEERNEELLNNKEEQEKFIKNLRKKLSKEYNIPEEEIIITNPQRGCFELSVIFLYQDEDFNLDIEDLKEKFKDEPELIKLKELQNELLLEGCKLKKGMLDPRGNNADGGWGKGEKRGGEDYIPPEGWIGYGLKVLDKYDLEKIGKQNDWISYDNREGEWCVAYHGVGNLYSSKKVKYCVNGIVNYNLKEKSKLKKFEEDKEEADEEEEEDEEDYAEDDDVKHPGNKVGKGVYCSPDPEIMDNYAGIIEINNEKYKMGFMLRVNPEKIRIPVGNMKFWVLNGNDDEVRPYRILVKKVEE